MKWLGNLFKGREHVYCIDCKHIGKMYLSQRCCNYFAIDGISYISRKIKTKTAFCSSYNEKGNCKAFEKKKMDV